MKLTDKVSKRLHANKLLMNEIHYLLCSISKAKIELKRHQINIQIGTTFLNSNRQ